MCASRIVFSDPDNLAAGLPLVRTVALGLSELGKVIFDELTVRLLATNASTAADTSILPDSSLLMRVKPGFLEAEVDLAPGWLPGDPIQPGKASPAYLGMHEGLHYWFRFDNPAFKALTIWLRDGPEGAGWYFHGQAAMAENAGRAIMVNEEGHLIGRGTEQTIMAEGWHLWDRPQVVSRLELKMLEDMGVALRSPVSAELARLYVATFDRAPDAEGIAYWQERLDAGMPLAEIAQSFFDQPEARAAFASGDLVELVYQQALGRAPDHAGHAWWTEALANGDVQAGAFVLAVIDGAQGSDRLALERAVDEHALAEVEIVGSAS